MSQPAGVNGTPHQCRDDTPDRTISGAAPSDSSAHRQRSEASALPSDNDPGTPLTSPTHDHSATDAPRDALTEAEARAPSMSPPEDSRELEVPPPAHPRPASLEPAPWTGIDITPCPPGGWPAVHLRDPDDIFYLQRKEQVEEWKALASSKVGVSLYDKSIGESGEAISMILRVLAAAGYPDVKISPPIAAKRRKNGPNTALVYDIPQEVADEITERHCVATIVGTVVAVSISPPIPTYLGTLQGFAPVDWA